MLIPAILKRNEIIHEFQKLYYTDNMMYETGCLEQIVPNIPDYPDEGLFQFAIVNTNDDLLGYLTYRINYYVSNVDHFGIISFDKGNPIVGKDLYNKMEELVTTMHRIEWCMIEGNPVEKHYDKFCEKHNGTKHVLRDVIRDKDGKYRSSIIYEIINEEVLK